MNFRKAVSDHIVSTLADGLEFVGEISFANGLRVDGVVRGKVRSDGFLAIGSTGKVEAELSIRRVSINGEFRGTIWASDRVEIHKDGKVYGDLYTPCLIIEAGALFEGRCNMGDGRAAKTEDAAILKVVESSVEDDLSVHKATGS